MNNENDFDLSNDNTFRKSPMKNYSSNNFGKSFFLPFISGIIGATLVIGTCFGVPTIKSKLINGTSSKDIITSASSSNSGTNVINLSEFSNTSIAVAEKVLPSVVGITITYPVNSLFGGSTTTEATGSGIIISEDGYILTNNHVVSSESSSSPFYEIGQAQSIKINIYNSDQTYDATIVGTDTYTDLAVLKVDANDLTPAILGNSDNVKVGEFVMAVGNPLGMQYSVTQGIVSAVNREVESDGTVYYAIQTDAAINSGNSGGALVNSNGEVIGVNTLKLAGTGIEGMGFAIPISSTTSIVNQLIENKTVKRPYIGISGSSLDSTTAQRYNLPEGVYVEEVEKDSPAEKAGLQKTDIITKIEGKEVKSVNELNKVKYTYNIGDTVTLSVYRNGENMEIKIVLAEEPEETKDDSNQTPNTQQQYSGSIFDFFNNY